jgi:ABC-type glycerol-3-phosphate transport system substrate-binding protein
MRRSIIFLLILALLLTCTSCQSKDTSTNNSDLTIYLLDSDLSTKQAVNRFNSAREKGRINIRTFFTDEIQKLGDTLFSELSNGTGPDIIVLYATYIHNPTQYFNLDAFYDINEFIRKDKAFKTEDYDNRILDCGVKDGKRYLIPLSYTVDALFTTGELLQTHNLNTDKKILSLDDLNTLAKSFTPQDGTAFINSLPYISFLNYFVDPMKQTASFDTEEFRIFMDQYQALNQSATVVTENSWDLSLLSQGKVALFNMPISNANNTFWPYQTYYKNGVDPVLLCYTLSDQEYSIPATPSVMVGINKNCANKEAAYEFIKQLLSTEDQQARGKNEAFPVNLAAYEKVMEGNLDFNTEQSASSIDNAAMIRLIAQMDEMAKGKLICRVQDYKIGDIVHEELMNYQTGSKTREMASRDIQSRVIAYFKEVPSVNAPSSQSDTPSQVEKLTLHFMEFNAYIKNAIRAFNEKYTDVQIEGTSYPVSNFENYKTQLTTSVMAGEGPDILIYRTFFFNSLSKTMATGAFADLNPLIENDSSFDTTAFYPEIFNAGIINGKRYFIPLYFTIPNLYAKKSGLAELGLTAAESGWTLNDLKDIVTKCKASNPAGDQYLFNSPMDFLSFVHSSGLQLVDYQNKTTNFQSKEFIDLMVLYKEMAPLILSSEAELNLGISPALLKDDKVRMIYLGDLAPTNLTVYNSVMTHLMGDDFIILPFPTAETGAKYPAELKDVVSINARCRNPQAAFDFIKILLSEDIQRTFDSHGINNIPSGQPVNKNAYIKDIEAEKKNPSGNLITMSDGIRTMTFKGVPLTDTVADMGVNLTNHMAAPAHLDYEIENIINEGVQAYLSGKRTAEQAAKEIDEKVALYLNE